MDFLMALLVRGVSDDSVSESIEDDLLDQAVADGLATADERDILKTDLATSRGGCGSDIAEMYLLGNGVRRDHSLAIQWHFLSGVHGSDTSARFCARWLASHVLDAVSKSEHARREQGHCIGHPWLAEALAAVTWWSAWSGRETEAISEPMQEHRYFVAGTPARILSHAVEGLRTRAGRSLKDFFLGRHGDSAVKEPEKPKTSVAEERKAKLRKLKEDTQRLLREAAQENAEKVAAKAGTLKQGLEYDPNEGWGDDDAPEDPMVDVVTYSPGAAPTLRPALDPIVAGPKGGGIPDSFLVLNEPLPVPLVDDLDSLEASLLGEFPYAERAIGMIMRDLRIRRQWGRDSFVIRPTLLVGPPGTGKTRLMSRLGSLSGVRHRIVPCAGSSDNRDIEGTSKGFSSANPSFFARFLASEGVGGGLIGFDEIDKASSGNQNGSVRDSLINVLQGAFYDPYLQTRLDLSGCSFLATANDTKHLPMPLLSRFRIVEVPQPGVEHLPGLIRGIRVDLASEYDIDPRFLPEFGDAEHVLLEQHYRKHRSVRSLRRAVEVILDHADRTRVLN